MIDQPLVMVCKLVRNIQDTKIAAWILDPKDDESDSYQLEKLISQYPSSFQFRGSPENQSEMTCKQTLQSWLLMKKLSDSLRSENLWDLFLNIEMPLGWFPFLNQLEPINMNFFLVSSNFS